MGEMSTWEERMSQRAKARERERIRPQHTTTDFSNWLEDDDPVGILQQILAARCLGIRYGDPGPRLPEELCRQCWGDRHVWLGNCWGQQHQPVLEQFQGKRLFGCQHECHVDEVWLAAV